MKSIACYIRVSAIEPNEAEQRREIGCWLKTNHINPKSVRWYIDKPAEDPQRRPRWEALQADILQGQVRTVVVWRLDRLSGTTRDGLKVLIDWCDKSLRVVSVSQPIEVKATDCGTVASILRGVAEMDEHTRRERTKAGLASARARGRLGGRPKLAADDPKVVMAKKLQKDHSLSIGDICQILEISRSTYYRHVGR
jgi:DNA invertase Pin-like site-specific DNA recombinase